MFENYSEKPLLALKSRVEDDWSVPGIIDPLHNVPVLRACNIFQLFLELRYMGRLL